jgi:hypothetical protein
MRRGSISDAHAATVLASFEKVIHDAELAGKIHRLSDKEKDPEFPDVCYRPTRVGWAVVTLGLAAMMEELCQSLPGCEMVERFTRHRSVSLAGQILATEVLTSDPQKKVLGRDDPQKKPPEGRGR